MKQKGDNMNIENLVTLLRNEIEKTNYKCYTPDLPQNDEVCSALSLGTGNHQRTLSSNILYSEIPFYILIRGTTDDTITRNLTDKIFNQLDMRENLTFKNARVILISCQSPNYAFRDENQKIHYNINCSVKVEWRNEESTIQVQKNSNYCLI